MHLLVGLGGACSHGCCARRSFDCISREPGEGLPTEGAGAFSALLSALEGNCKYPDPEPAAAARRSFSAPLPAAVK